MSLNQKIVLLVILVGAVAAIAFFETRSETPNGNDSTATATSSSDAQTADDSGLDLTREAEESSADTSNTDDGVSSTDASEESTTSTESSQNGSSSQSSSETSSDTSSEGMTFSGEFATTEHETNKSEAVETEELTLTPGDEPSSQGLELESNENSGDSAEGASESNQLTTTSGDSTPSANATSSTTTSESTSDSTSGNGYETYEVQSGDNLWKIAKKHYDSGTQWKRIKKANADKISDSNDLKQGQTLRIPTDEPSTTASGASDDGGSSQDIVVQQASSGSQTMTNGSSSSDTTASDRSGDGAETDSSSSYTVQEGDRLWNIVKEQYGSATYERVQSVADHNDINPRDLRPGMELELPADLSSTESTGSSSATQTSSSGNASSTAGNPPFEPDPGQKWYRVQDGENLWKISEKEYGSGKYFSRIWELNKDRLEDYNSLSSGTWVLLPENP